MQGVLLLTALLTVVDGVSKNPFEAAEPKLRTNIKAYYVNLEKSTARAECMSRQLTDQGIENERYLAAVMPPCNDWDLKCMQAAVFTENHDCFKGGADLIHMLSHGSKNNNASTWQLAGGVLANWCSHKRLFEDLSNKSKTTYDFAQLGGGVLRSLHLKGEEKSNATVVENVYLIMEDDAILKPNFGDAVEDFVRHYDGKWDLVQIDTFGSKLDGDKVGEYKGASVYHPSVVGEYFGLHALLVKESSVPKLNFEMALMPAVPVDWLPKLLKDVPDTTALVWNPDIVINPEIKMWSGDAGEKFLPKYCKNEILLSTIGGEAINGEVPHDAPTK